LVDYSNTLYIIAPGFTEYTFPAECKAVYGNGSEVWKNARNITKITLNEAITNVSGEWFLYGLSKLTEVAGPETHPGCSFYNGCVYNKDFSELIYYPAGKAYTEDQLHENTVKFGNYSFVKHTKLDRIVIPAQIVELGTWVFYSTPITEAIIHANVQSIGNNCFA
jgi:hypothetical protein